MNEANTYYVCISVQEGCVVPNFLQYIEKLQELALNDFGVMPIQSITLAPEEFLDIVIEAKSDMHSKPYDLEQVSAVRSFLMTTDYGDIDIIKGE